MLAVLKIQNLALVDSLVWELGEGLVCVTGETGAGKSVIVGAVKLVLGERADRSLVRTGTDACSIEALFALRHPGAVNALLEESGIDPCVDGELIIRRVIGAGAGSAGNRQFVNGSPCTLATLKEIGRHLVDLHGPHDHQSLLSRERQLAMLDAYAGDDALLRDYREAFAGWRASVRDYEDLLSSERASAQEVDLLRFQIAEIEAAELKPGEDEEIEARYRVASNSQKLVEAAKAALSIIGDGVLEQMAELARHLASLHRIDPSSEAATAGASVARIELEELETALQHYMDSVEIDPAEARRLEARLDTIESLKRKYGGSIDEILGHLAAARTRLDRIDNRADELERLKAAGETARTEVRKLGERLSKARRKAAPQLGRDVSKHLSELGFKRCHFEIQLAAHESPGPHGLEDAEFVFAPNPGEPPKPLRQIASSGEMSRTMLAVKSALMKEDDIPLLIFDEIDANVGGEIAAAVGAKMADLGASHQVVSITHLPQVAALADSHFVVTKEIEGDRTRSCLHRVEADHRVAEIARMLGGRSESATAHARSLLSARIRPVL